MNVAKANAPPNAIYRPKPRSEAEARAEKRQLELISEDVKRVCTDDIHRPFASVQDALDRLLPYHMLGDLDGDAADLDEMPAGASADLLIGRRDGLADLALHRAIDAARKVEAARQSVEAVVQGFASRGGTATAASASTPDASGTPRAKGPLALDQLYVLDRLLAGSAREWLELERRKPPGYRSPVRTDAGMLYAGSSVGGASGLDVAGLSHMGIMEAPGILPSVQDTAAAAAAAMNAVTAAAAAAAGTLGQVEREEAEASHEDAGEDDQEDEGGESEMSGDGVGEGEEALEDGGVGDAEAEGACDEGYDGEDSGMGAADDGDEAGYSAGDEYEEGEAAGVSGDGMLGEDELDDEDLEYGEGLEHADGDDGEGYADDGDMELSDDFEDDGALGEG